MKSGVPWSIGDIDDDIREVARAAARQSGVSVAEWLNDLIARQIAVGGKAPERPHKEDGEENPEEIAEAVRHLTGRIRAMDHKSRSALSGLQNRLDEIEERLRGAASETRSTDRTRSLRDVANIVKELSREIDNVDEAARSTVEGLRDRGSARTQRRETISAVTKVAEAPSPSETPASLETIKERLDALLAQAPERSTDRVTALDATLRALEGHIDEARNRLSASIPPRPSSPRSPADEHRMRRIDRQLAEFAAEIEGRLGGPGSNALSRSDLASAVAEISARQRTIDERADISAVTAEQSRLTSVVMDLRTEIASLAEHIASTGRTGDDEHEAYSNLADHIAALAAELPRDRETLAAIHHDVEAVRSVLAGGGLDRIAGRIEELLNRTPEAGRLDALAEEVGAIRRAFDADDSPNAIARLEKRVSELARGVEAAFKAGGGASRGGSVDAVARLESRLDTIAARIDSFLGRAASTGAIDDMQKRLGAILDRFDKASRRDPGAALDEIKSEIAEIRRDIAGRPPLKIDHLEKQIAELARGLESMAHTGPDGQGLSELEAQVAHLASELERSMPRTATLKQVEENLARLQAYLSSNREESIEAARTAAREAVRDFTEAPGESDLVRALKDDLENIRSAANNADQRTQETLGSVHGTLARVVDRLARLEQEADESGPEALALRVEPASTAAGGPQTAEGDHLLEPGSGKPDLAALRELARSASEAHRGRYGDRKADFIAAARRAAQVAAEATTDEPEDEPGQERPGAFARIGQAIRNRKRPLLIAAAAIVLAISAVQLFGERGVRTLDMFPDLAESTFTVEKLPATNSSLSRPAESVPTAPAVSKVDEPSLVAPPPDGQTAIAFAAPEDFGGRFGDGPAGPTANGFSSITAAPGEESADATTADLASPVPGGMTAAASIVEAAAAPSKLREAAAAGDPSAAFEIAARYAEGQGAERDLPKAAEWYRRAAEAGVAVAQYRLGSLYERGQGVSRDPAAAIIWYQRAADQGNVGAMHNLAVMMSEGVDGSPDHAKAFDWFLAAAKCGVRDSQYNLGVIYARGLGQEQDLVESYKWFAIAAASGDADAAARRDEVTKALSADDLAKARATVQAWRATPVITEANTVARPAGSWEDSSDGLTEADRRALVRTIQTLLAEKGYDPGPLDGFVGPQTQHAVRAFQRNIGVAETGQITGDLVTALATPST